MAKNLFALEEEQIGGTDVEMEVSPEEGEVADIQTEVDAGAGDIAEVGEAVADGLQASSELEEVEEVVEQAAEQGEGLDPVAAEAVRIAISAIASKVGANPRSVYSLYATENFMSASNRKGNTAHALEGVQEFLKDLWKKIKAAVTKLWAKAKDFWAKHISNVGRVKKALESMKAKVKASSGKMKGKPYLDKAPSGLISAFPGKGDLTIKQVQDYLASVQGLLQYPGVTAIASNAQVPLAKDFDRWTAVVQKVIGEMNRDKGTLVIGGSMLRVEADMDQEAGTLKLEIQRDPVEEKDDDRGMPVVEKSALLSLLQTAQDGIKKIIDTQKNADKAAEASTKFLNGIEKAIAGENLEPEDQKAVRNAMRIGYKLAAFDAQIGTVAVAENVKACKAVLGYVAANLNQQS